MPLKSGHAGFQWKMIVLLVAASIADVVQKAAVHTGS